MVEGYVQVPTDESGKKLRTWLSGSVHSESVVLSLADANNTFIDPRLVSLSGASISLGITGSSTNSAVLITGSIDRINNTVVVVGTAGVTGSSTNSAVLITGSIDRINNAVSIVGTVGITGSGPSSAILVTGSVYQAGTWSVAATISDAMVTGSQSDSSVKTSGSMNQLGQWNVRATGSSPDSSVIVSGSVNQLGQWSVRVTGSSPDSSVVTSGSVNQLGQWNIRATGSSSDGSVIISGSVNPLGQWAVYATGSGPSGAVLVTGSVYQAGAWNVTGSINNWPTSYAVTESGQWSINATGSGPSGAVLVTGSSYQAGAWNVTGSINNWPSTYATTESGQWTINVTGSGTTPLPVSISGSINRVISGSGVYSYASAAMVTGSININNFGATTAGTATIGAVVVSGSGWQATLTRGSGSDNARYALDVNPIKTQTYKSQGVSGSISANSIATLITGLANRHLKVYSIIYNQSGSSANQIAFFSSGSGQANAQLLGPMPLGINEGFANAVSPPAWILCTAVVGSTLYVSSSAAAVHGGVLSYWDDDAT